MTVSKLDAFLMFCEFISKNRMLKITNEKTIWKQRTWSMLSFQLTEFSLSAISSILRFKQWFRMLTDGMR